MAERVFYISGHWSNKTFCSFLKEEFPKWKIGLNEPDEYSEAGVEITVITDLNIRLSIGVSSDLMLDKNSRYYKFLADKLNDTEMSEIEFDNSNDSSIPVQQIVERIEKSYLIVEDNFSRHF